MTAMGLYQRDQRTQPAAVMVRLVLSFACGFVLMGTAYLVYPNLMVGGATFAVGFAAWGMGCFEGSDVSAVPAGISCFSCAVSTGIGAASEPPPSSSATADAG